MSLAWEVSLRNKFIARRGALLVPENACFKVICLGEKTLAKIRQWKVKTHEMCWNRVMVWHRCISAFKFKTILASAIFLLFLLYCILDPSKSEYPVNKRRTLKRVFEERRERMENYCDADKSTPKTPLRELLPPKKPNFHILENLRRPILLCAPKKVSGDLKTFWIQITWTQGWLDDLLLGLSHSPWRRWWGELGIGTKQVQKVKMHHIENNKTKPKTLRAQQRHLAANLRIGNLAFTMGKWF